MVYTATRNKSGVDFEFCQLAEVLLRRVNNEKERVRVLRRVPSIQAIIDAIEEEKEDEEIRLDYLRELEETRVEDSINELWRSSSESSRELSDREASIGDICSALSEEAERAYRKRVKRMKKKNKLHRQDGCCYENDVSTCCANESAVLYCDFVNFLAYEDKSSLDLTEFQHNFELLSKKECSCEGRRMIISLIQKEMSIEVQTVSGSLSRMIFGEPENLGSMVDEKIVKVGDVLSGVARNIKHDLTPEAKRYIDEKFARLENLADNGVKLSIPDVTGLGNILTRLFTAENMGSSCVVLFCILYLSRKYCPSLGDICALFAGMSVCYIGGDLIMPIILSWLRPTTQSAGEWIAVVSEVIGISMFALKGKWELDLTSILANFVEIERQKPLLDQLLERVQNLVFSIIRLSAEACGKEFISDYSPMAEKIRMLRKRVNSINKDPSRRTSPTIAFVNDVFKLHDDIMELYESVSVLKGSERYMSQVRDLINIIKPLCEYLESNRFVSGSRFSPFTRTLVGFSGVGKTAISEEMNREVYEVYATEEMKLDSGRVYGKIVYPVQSGHKHFESYNGQFVTQINDYLQKREKLGDEFSPTEYIIQACGNSVQLLKVALMSKKDKVKQASLVFDISTNVYCINKITCPTVQDAQPINRRLAGVNNSGFPCIMAVHEDYGMEVELPPGTVYPTAPEGKPKNYFELTLDMSKVPLDREGNPDFTNVYEFYDWSFVSGQLKRGYRKYNKEEYKAEFLRRFDLHYNAQIKFLRSAAARGPVDLDNLPKSIVVQGKSFDDLVAYEEHKIDRSNELFNSVMNDTPTPMYDSEQEFEKLRCANPDLLVDGYDSETGLVGHQPFFDEDIMTEVQKELAESYAVKVEDVIVRAMETTVADPENGLSLDGLSLPQKRLMRGWSLEEMKDIVACKFTDPMVKALKKVVSSGMIFAKAFSLVTFSLLGVVEIRAKVFMRDPLAWFKGHPFVSIALAGITGLAVYKTIKMCINFFRGTCGEAGPKSIVYTSDEELKQCNAFYIKHLNTPGMMHTVECCSQEAIRKAYYASLQIPILSPITPVMAEVVTQGAIPGDKKWEFANSALENFYTFWVRYTYINPDGTTVLKVEDECVSLALKGHLYNLHYHILRLMISSSRLKACRSVEFGLTPILTASTPAVWIDFKKIKWIIREDSVARDEVWFQMPSNTKIHTSAIKKMPVKDPEFLRVLESGRFPVKFFRNVGRTTPLDAVLKKGRYSYPIPRGVIGTAVEDLLPEAVANFEGFQIDIETLGGDCGAPCFMWSNSFSHLSARNKVFQHPFIVYRHSAWTNLLKYGFGGCYFQEDYNWIEPFVLSKVNTKDRLTAIEENIEHMVQIANDVTNQCKSYVPLFTSREVSAPIADHHVPVGSINEVKINRKNDIKRSELFPFIKKEFGITKMPVKMGCLGPDDPLVKGIQNYGGNKDYVSDPLEEKVITDFIVADFINKSSPITDEMRELIPIPTCIVGGDGLKGLNRKSGIGPSLTHMCKSMGIDPLEFKKCFGTEGEYDMDNPNSRIFIKIAEDAMDAAKSGEAYTVLFQNHLKVECKDGDKVRLFHGADKTSVPVFISSFGGLIKWLVANKIKNGFLVGCNPAKDWQTMWSHLTSVSEYGFAGDFGKFDKFQIAFLVSILYHLAVAFYGDLDPEGNIAREAIFESLKSPSFVLALGESSCVYSWQHGNCSGNVLTTFINCFSDVGILYKCIVRILKSHSRFKDMTTYEICCYIRDNVAYEIMGDDHIVTLSKELREYVNFYNYQKAVFDVFGMEYTDDCKGRRIDFVVPLHSHLYEMTILARGIKNLDGRIVAPLRDSSLFESLAWYKGKERDPNLKLLDVERTLAELAPRGRVDYSRHGRKIANAAYKYLGVYPERNTSFETALSSYHDLKFPEYNIYQDSDDEQETDSGQVYDPFDEIDFLIKSIEKS
jgi:hypothetical protein